MLGSDNVFEDLQSCFGGQSVPSSDASGSPDGSIAELSVIRPLWWLQGTGAAVGGSIDIGLHEIGRSGEATVLAIGPCDVDSRETRPGMSIVTGTIRHRNATVWDLTFDDLTEETLGVIANHPI